MSCDHEVIESEDIVVEGPGHIMSTCANCQREIWAKEIDHEYFKDSGEIVILNWEVL
jgi:hypothetical protein